MWAIVPVKELANSKSRLAAVLSAEERAALTRRLLRRTLGVSEGTLQTEDGTLLATASASERLLEAARVVK